MSNDEWEQQDRLLTKAQAEIDKDPDSYVGILLHALCAEVRALRHKNVNWIGRQLTTLSDHELRELVAQYIPKQEWD